MKSLPPELIYLLVIGAILLFNYVMQQLAKQRQAGELPREEPEQDEPLPELWGRAPRAPAADLQPGVPPVPSRVTEARPDTADVPRRLSHARSLLQGRRNLRRAIVIMTVLGPCRAQESPGGATAETFPGRTAP